MWFSGYARIGERVVQQNMSYGSNGFDTRIESTARHPLEHPAPQIDDVSPPPTVSSADTSCAREKSGSNSVPSRSHGNGTIHGSGETVVDASNESKRAESPARSAPAAVSKADVSGSARNGEKGRTQTCDDRSDHAGRADELMFTHFLVTGLSPRSALLPGTSYEPELLWHFPQAYPNDERGVLNAICNPKLGRFCFPEGVSVRAVNRRNRLGGEMLTEELRRLLTGETANDKAATVHTFRLFGDDTGVMYGLCVICEDLVCTLPTFLPGGSAGVPENAKHGPQTLAAPRCYTFLSHHPFFELQLDVVLQVLRLEAKARTKNLAGGSSETHRVHSSLEPIVALLGAFHSLPIPFPGDTLTIQVPRSPAASSPVAAAQLSFTWPQSSDYPDLLARWSLVPLFNSVSLEHVLALFAALLTERQILAVCSNLSVVSALVIAVKPLLGPLSWQGLLIPVLPRNLQDMLMAPVPFVVGAQRMPSPDVMPPDVVVLDIDRNRIFVTAGGAASGTGAFSYSGAEADVSTGAVPALPEAVKLRHNVRREYTHLRELTMLHRKEVSGPQSYASSEAERETANRILEAWHKYLRWLLAKVSGFYQASEANMEDMRERDRVNASFVASVTGSNRDFVRQFTSTQFLSDYVTRTLGAPTR